MVTAGSIKFLQGKFMMRNHRIMNIKVKMTKLCIWTSVIIFSDRGDPRVEANVVSFMINSVEVTEHNIALVCQLWLPVLSIGGNISTSP